MTVKNIVDDLMAKNIIYEKKIDKSPVGRIPTVLNIYETIGYILAIDLSSKSILYYVIYNVYRNKVSDGYYNCNPNVSYEENLKEFIRHVKDVILKNEYKNIIGIGISVPGVYNAEQDTVNNELIKDLNHIHLKKLFYEDFPIENIIIDHDVKLAALAEYVALGDSDLQDFYYLFIGEGVGGAFILKGEIYSGHDELAGDIGQMIVDCSGNDCTNLESIVSCPSIVNEVQRKLKEDDMDEGRNVSRLDFVEILNMYKAGNKIVTGYIHDVLMTLAKAIYNIIWLANPQKIIIGSSYPEFGEIVVTKVKEYLKKLLIGKIQIGFEICLSRHEARGSLVGAFELVTDKWIDDL